MSSGNNSVDTGSRGITVAARKKALGLKVPLFLKTKESPLKPDLEFLTSICLEELLFVLLEVTEQAIFFLGISKIMNPIFYEKNS